MIYFNKDIFAQEGLKAEDIPTNWDDFIKLAQQLTITDSDGKVTRAGCGMNDYWQHEYLWQGLIYQQGGWMLVIYYRNRGSRSQGQHGVLFKDGVEVKPRQVGEIIQTDLGDLKYVMHPEDMTVLWDMTGWTFAG